MQSKLSVLFVPLLLVFAACEDPAGPEGTRYIEIREVTVGPALAKCYGVGLQSCMVVDGGLFYDGIEGFEFEAGYNYRLRIGVYDPWDGREPPQDAGRYAYRLLEQLEKTRAPSTPVTLAVGPTRVKCARVDDFCLLIDGAPYNDMITNFDYEAGYHYTLDANRYNDGRYVLNEISSKTEAAAVGEEEISVGPHRIKCDDSYPVYCNVVNDEALRSEIVNFRPWHDYSYRLRVERFSMFTDGISPSSADIPTYGYRWLETLERNSSN